MTEFNWDDVFSPVLDDDAHETPRDQFEAPWKHRIARAVMIELLVAEGVVWAGWYRPTGLQAKYGEVFGRCLQGAFRPKRRARY